MLTIEVLLQSFFVFTANWTHRPYIKGEVDACLGFLFPKELDWVQTRVLVEPHSKHGASRHGGHDSKRVVKFVTFREVL